MRFRKVKTLRRSRGVALIMVLVAVAIMVMSAAVITVRFNRVFFVTRNALDYQRASWYVDGIEGIIRKYMIDDFRKTKGKVYKGMTWAQPNQVVPLDEAVISGDVHDEQACLNINGLLKDVVPDNETPEQRENTDSRLLNARFPVLVFRELLMNMGADETQAETVSDSAVDWLDADSTMVSANAAEDQFYSTGKMPHVTANGRFYEKSELRYIRGMTPELYRRIEPMICALPTDDFVIRINMLNYRQAPLLQALLMGQLSLEEAVDLLKTGIPEYGWDSYAGFLREDVINNALESMNGLRGRVAKVAVTNSNYFVANVVVQFDDEKFAFRSRFYRDGDTSLKVYQRLRGELHE